MWDPYGPLILARDTTHWAVRVLSIGVGRGFKTNVHNFRNVHSALPTHTSDGESRSKQQSPRLRTFTDVMIQATRTDSHGSAASVEWHMCHNQTLPSPRRVPPPSRTVSVQRALKDWPNAASSGTPDQGPRSAGVVG